MTLLLSKWMLDESSYYSRHAALLTRVSMLVSDSTIKLSSFRSAVRQYRNNESGAKDMVDTIYHVLDRDPDATSGVVREIASLFEGEAEKDKRSAVLEALNGFQIEVCQEFFLLHALTRISKGSSSQH